MREINRIIVHCSFTKPRLRFSPKIGAKQIRSWHLERGFRDIGYHYVIKRDGTLQLGRPIEQVGAHVRGYNKDSIGICLVGGMSRKTGKAVNDYTSNQWQTLRMVVGGLMMQFPHTEILGHNNLTNKKTCPNFDVLAWWEKIREPFDEYLGIEELEQLARRGATPIDL